MQSINRTTYDKIAESYAQRPLYSMERELNTFLSYVPQGGLVVDIGCGPGDYAQMIRERGYRVIALDLSAGMLKIAAKRGPTHLTQADMRWLPLPANVIDGAFLSASLLHLPRAAAPQTLKAVKRVLRRGGVAYLSMKEGCGSAHILTPEGEPRFFTYYQPAELDALLRAAELTVLESWSNLPGPQQSHRWLNRVVRRKN